MNSRKEDIEMLTKKHFEALAQIVANHYTRELEDEITTWCRAQNPRFDETRFKARVEDLLEGPQGLTQRR